MPKTKISEFSATAGNNTDIDGINISEGCPPSGINDAIRELMAQLKDFQAGTAGDSFNGPIGATTPAAGTFTNLSASGTFALTGDQVQISEGGTGQTTANAAFNALAPSQTSQAGKYLKTDGTNTSWDAIEINTADITGTLPVANGGTGLTALGTGVQTALGQNVTGSGGIVLASSPSLTTPNLGTPSAVTLTNATGLPLSTGVTGTLATTNGGTGLTSFTANGVVYASSTSALTTGSALTFDGTNLGVGVTPTANQGRIQANGAGQSWFKFYDSSAGWNFGTFYKANGTTALAYLGSGGGNAIAGATVDDFVVRAEGNLVFTAGGGTEAMRLTSTSLYTASGINVGIGTSSPGEKLTISATTGTTAKFLNSVSYGSLIGLASTATGGKEWQLHSTANGDGTTGGGFFNIVNATDASVPFRLSASGNLGLGVTPSAWVSSGKALQVGNSAGLLSSTALEATVTNNCYLNSGATAWIYLNTAQASRYQQYQGVHSWFTAASGTAGNAISFTQAMTLDASGNLGVGTTSPIRRLDVVSSNTDVFQVIRSTSSSPTNVALRIQDATTGTGISDGLYLGRASSINYLWAYENEPLVFGTNSLERARITDGGVFLVGTTSAISSGATIKDANGVSVYRNDANAAYQGFSFYSDNGGTQTTRAYFRNDGGLANYSANNANLSDVRLKKDIAPAGDYLAKICAIEVKNFRFKSQDESEDITLGVIAQEVEAVAPELVCNDGFGETPEDGIPLKSIYQTDLQYALMKCIQELKSQNDDLRARVAQLEAK